LNIGANDLGNPLYCNVDIAEVMTFNKKLTGADLRRVESYLAIKYGITLGNNRGTGAEVIYMASDGMQIWNSKTAYHNYVIGIGRDNAAGASGLNKLKSTSTSSLNGSTDILTIANGTSLSSPSSFGTNNSFFISGTNALTLASTAASLLDLPAGIARRLERVWQGQETGTVGTLRLEFNMSTVPGVAGVPGANDLANVRLLVDADGVFSSGATIISPSTFNNTTDLVEFQVDFTAGTGFYYTIGSIDAINAPLPVELISYEVKCDQEKVLVSWSTASESNNDYFTVSRSGDDMLFTPIKTIQGANNSNETKQYFVEDANPINGRAYYKLSQTDLDGTSEHLGIKSVECKDNGFGVYFNAQNNELHLNTETEGEMVFNLFDASGRKIHSATLWVNQGSNKVNLGKLNLASGMYLFHLSTTEHRESHKIYIR
jgi:hypothetical protein